MLQGLRESMGINGSPTSFSTVNWSQARTQDPRRRTRFLRLHHRDHYPPFPTSKLSPVSSARATLVRIYASSDPFEPLGDIPSSWADLITREGVGYREGGVTTRSIGSRRRMGRSASRSGGCKQERHFAPPIPCHPFLEERPR